MGKTDKCKKKAAAKVAKAKGKIARKTKGACALFLAFGLALLCGCSTSDSAQPAKSQTQNNSFEDCIIVVATKCSVSNRIVRADGTKDIPAVELFTQTPTTDVKPDLDVHYNDAMKNATDASKGVLESLIDTSAKSVLQMMAEKKTGTVQVTKTDGSTATVECKDGQCSLCTDGSCTPAK